MHATFITCVAGAWLTRGAELADWHAVFGYLALGALAFRIAWGFIGPTHARFASFAYTPWDAMRYMRGALSGNVAHYTGHNPAGSWAVYLLLAMLAAVCASGVVASAAMHGLGPLAGAVGPATGEFSFSLHEFLAWSVLVAVPLHVAGVVWGSRVHHENLALAMVTGDKADHGDAAAPAPARAPLAIALVLSGLAGATVYMTWNVPRDIARRDAQEAIVKKQLAPTPWTKECGSCHLAYSPAMLPARSWERMMREQDRHFGEDLSLGKAAIERLLQESRAPQDPPWASRKLAASARPADAPQRISELRFWRHAHEHVPAEHFAPPFAAGRHECEACHRDAASGIFHPRMIQGAKPGTRS